MRYLTSDTATDEVLKHLSPILCLTSLKTRTLGRPQKSLNVSCYYFQIEPSTIPCAENGIPRLGELRPKNGRTSMHWRRRAPARPWMRKHSLKPSKILYSSTPIHDWISKLARSSTIYSRVLSSYILAPEEFVCQLTLDNSRPLIL